ncbi:MAG: SDR family NAD(P)-dependent oxidoreductase [Saprospiraceae bacterium]|nr:SDR family NAD(P)-dependent oxidoreductase [Saprospiraceae bacterium]MDZ4705219.1 SDR family NAD(P)-dependent oxidoreductase [Saprospiraceae bacterium]
MTDFSNKTVLITGGSRGIGRATALAFAESGARVAINFRANSAAAQAVCELFALSKAKLQLPDQSIAGSPLFGSGLPQRSTPG